MENKIIKIYVVFAKLIGSFNSTLQTVFIVLKLLKLINWSWWVVFMPMWVGLAIAIPGLLYVWYQYRHLTKRSPDADTESAEEVAE